MPVTAPADPYKEALERLYGLERGNKGPFGLEGTRALLADLGNPERAFKSIHVAGTNGKGSTCAFLERVLRELGWHTGLFTSPHLLDFRERIRIDGRCVAPEVVARDLARIRSVPAGNGRTFFEATFALGALAFADAKVDIAVLETGLGGRLDATNVVTPVLSVITPIGLDHQDMLGDTIEKIAAEKAGIIKPGVPVLVARQDPRALAVIEQKAVEMGSVLHHVDDGTRVTILGHGKGGTRIWVNIEERSSAEYVVRLVGRHQVDNALLALLAVNLVDPELDWIPRVEGIAATRWPGRLERSEQDERVWWDGAHNPQGAATLRAAWRESLHDPVAVMVLGVSDDKDLDAMLEALTGPWRRVITTRSKAPRAMDERLLAERVAAAWPFATVLPVGNVASALHQAIAAREAGENVLVCGSLFVVGEAMAELGADLEQL